MTNKEKVEFFIGGKWIPGEKKINPRMHKAPCVKCRCGKCDGERPQRAVKNV